MANATAKAKPKNIASDFGFSYAIIQSDPGLAKWFNDFAARYTASHGKIDEKRFWLELQAQPWWKQHSATYIKDLQQQTDNPVDYEQSIASDVATMKAAADTMGARLTDDQLKQLAQSARRFGWNAQQTQKALADYVDVNPASGYLDFEGNAGVTQDDLQSWAYDNGVDLTDKLTTAYVKKIAAGETTLDEVKSDIRKTYMAGAFPAWADKINAGMDIADIAAPYKATMAKLLEMDDNTIDFKDPLLAAGLQSVDAQGKPVVMPLYQYQNLIRKDPRWQKTDNAYSTYANVASNILQTWGFA